MPIIKVITEENIQMALNRVLFVKKESHWVHFPIDLITRMLKPAEGFMLLGAIPVAD